MKRNPLLLSQLMAYSRSDRYPFHMPGHKRNGKVFPNPYSIDITEIDGFDNLHHPEGILKESMEWAASVYGADRTYYLVNGSSGGILSAMFGTVGPGGKILVSRNCHKSVYHGGILGGMDVEYVYPQIVRPLGIQGGILAEDVEKMLTEHPDTKAVLIVSPTYDGMVSDIRAIAGVVHEMGIPLIVDEAHGAHFAFGHEAGFPESALLQGADVVIQSLHKTLPSFTQTAVLHLREGLVRRERIERYLQMFQSSSPSYVLMAGIEACIDQMVEDGKRWMEEFAGRIGWLRERLGALKRIRLVGRELCGQYGICDVDLSKIVVSVRDCVWIDMAGQAYPVDGAWLDGVLREEYHLEMEMCGADYVVAITTGSDSQEGLARLVDALLAVDARLERREPIAGIDTDGGIAVRPVVECRMADAMDAPSEERELSDCAGWVSTEFIYLYPPGIPIVAPGERMTEEIVDLVLAYRRMGLPVQGMADHAAGKLRVMRKDAAARDGECG